jgi:hypothetical protein
MIFFNKNYLVCRCLAVCSTSGMRVTYFVGMCKIVVVATDFFTSDYYLCEIRSDVALIPTCYCLLAQSRRYLQSRIAWLKLPAVTRCHYHEICTIMYHNTCFLPMLHMCCYRSCADCFHF